MPATSKAELKALIAKLNDAVDQYDESDNSENIQTRAAIRGVAREISDSVCEPLEKTWQQIFHMSGLIALRTFIQLGVFEKIPLDGSISAVDLAKAVNAHEELIERQGRVLVGTGMLSQSRPDGGDYQHTKFSRPFASPNDTEVGLPGIFFHACYEFWLKTIWNLDEFVESKRAENDVYRLPMSNTKNTFVSAYGKEGQNTWEVMASVPKVMRLLHTGLKFMEKTVPPVGPFFDYSSFATSASSTNGESGLERKEFVDIGGGTGSVLTNILKATPALDPKKCVLQDVKGPVDLAGAVRDLGVETQVIDFHKGQPVQGAKAYYMRFIMHNYSDPEAINILTHIAGAMAPDSVLVVAENIIPDRLVEATIPTGALDALMWTIGGKERTEDGFRYIFEQAGLELSNINRIPGSSGAVLEAKLKR